MVFIILEELVFEICILSIDYLKQKRKFKHWRRTPTLKILFDVSNIRRILILDLLDLL